MLDLASSAFAGNNPPQEMFVRPVRACLARIVIHARLAAALRLASTVCWPGPSERMFRVCEVVADFWYCLNSSAGTKSLTLRPKMFAAFSSDADSMNDETDRFTLRAASTITDLVVRLGYVITSSAAPRLSFVPLFLALIPGAFIAPPFGFRFFPLLWWVRYFSVT